MDPIAPLSVFPNHEDRGGIEDRRVSTAENANQQDDDKVPDGLASKQSQREQGEHDDQLGI